MTTVVFYTDHTLPEALAAPVQRILLAATAGMPVVSVSQRPMALGRNLAIGPQPRSHLTMYRQLLLGVEAADTDTIALAEHDVLYTREHVQWTPPTLTTFYYNAHHWFADAKPGPGWGTFSWTGGKRVAMSQLICGRDILLANLRQRIAHLEAGWTLRRGVPGVCEPGYGEETAFAESTPENTPPHPPATFFTTSVPNVDLRHGGNFTGWRRGVRCCPSLPPWGFLKAVLPHA